MQQNFLNLLPEELRDTISKMYDLILERALLRAYQNLDDGNKTLMAKIFDSGTEEEKINFLKEYLGDLQRIMIEETKKAAEEIKK